MAGCPPNLNYLSFTLFPSGGKNKTWKDRWVVVKDNVLYYFKEKDDKAPCGIVMLHQIEARLVEPETR